MKKNSDYKYKYKEDDTPFSETHPEEYAKIQNMTPEELKASITEDIKEMLATRSEEERKRLTVEYKKRGYDV